MNAKKARALRKRAIGRESLYEDKITVKKVKTGSLNSKGEAITVDVQRTTKVLSTDSKRYHYKQLKKQERANG